MVDYLNNHQAAFFEWCDETVRAHISKEGTTLSQWRPRKNPDGTYELVFELTPPGGEAARVTVPVPKQFHELLETEYFAQHADHEDEL